MPKDVYFCPYKMFGVRSCKTSKTSFPASKKTLDQSSEKGFPVAVTTWLRTYPQEHLKADCMNTEQIQKCINCKRAGLADDYIRHSPFYINCPIRQTELRKSTNAQNN